MGLDSSLYAKRYISDIRGDVEFNKQFDNIKIAGNPILSVTAEVAYWRKANAIHKWFVFNAQRGVDDCREYYVSLETLKRLLDVVNEVLNNKSMASTLLPTTDGFFFGETGYDKWYFNKLEYTKTQLSEILENEEYKNCSFYYSSSW